LAVRTTDFTPSRRARLTFARSSSISTALR
jgi:hypothetical protein